MRTKMLPSLKSSLFRAAVALLLLPPLASAQFSRPLIPFDAVPKREDRVRLLNIAADYTLYRELPPAVIEGNQAQYDFLMDHLDLTTFVVRKLDLGQQVLREAEANVLEGDDGDGLTGRMSLVYRDPAKRIFLARGRLQGVLFNVSGRAAIVAERVPENGGRQGLHLALYVKLDNPLLDVMTHVFSPLLSGAVMRRISKFLTATSVASQAIRKDPERIRRILRDADRLDARTIAEFSALFPPKGKGGPSPGAESAEAPPVATRVEGIRP